MTEDKKILQDNGRKRLEYMVAWRERYIRTLEERLEGREEENLMLQTLLFYALSSAGEKSESGVVSVPIHKQAVADSLGQWSCDTSDEGETYLVTFTPAPSKKTGDARGDEKAE